MPEEPEVFKKLAEAEATPDLFVPFTGSYEMNQQIIEHKTWLKTIRHEKPSPKCHYRVGIYIRYFNQTKHDNYLEYHIRQYQDTMALYPNWDLVGFYIDEGATAPNMESAKEWCRLLSDCFSGKIDLIITQKVSNVSKKHYEITIIARLLAALKNPVGIYFVSENIFTLASYYLHDNHDKEYFPSEDWEVLPEDEAEDLPLLTGGVDDMNSFSANILNGITKLISVFGDQLNDEVFKEKVGAISIKQLVRTAKERQAGSMGYAEAMLIEYNGKKKNPAQRLSMNKLHARESSIFSGLEDSTAPDEEWAGDSETEEDSVF